MPGPFLGVIRNYEIKIGLWGFPGGPVVKNLPANAGDTSLILDQGKFHMLWGN